MPKVINRESSVYDYSKTKGATTEKCYSWNVGLKSFDVYVWLYDDVEHMLMGYDKNSNTYKKQPRAIFHRFAKNGKMVGCIKIAAKELSKEDIIHESFHAGIELNYHLGRHLSRKYEENIVEASASLAAQIIYDFAEYIKCDRLSNEEGQKCLENVTTSA